MTEMGVGVRRHGARVKDSKDARGSSEIVCVYAKIEARRNI